MKRRRTIVRRRIMSLRGLDTSVYLILALLSVISTESEGTRRSPTNLRSIGNGAEELAVPNDSKMTKIESNFGLSSSETEPNSPALNLFLKNVLQAQDELKWIDQAVRRVEAKENPEKVPSRYLGSSFHTPAALRNAKIRLRRRSDPRSYGDEDPWTSTKRRHVYDDHNPDRIYLDDEMKVKRQANHPYQGFDRQGYRPSRRTHFERSAVDDNGEPVDDSTLKNWAKKEGLRVPGDWFDAGQSSVEKSDETSADHWPRSDYDEELRDAGGSDARMDDFSRNVDDWVDNARDERDAGHLSQREKAEQPTLESLKETVLELRRSLDDSDKKMNALDEKEGDFGLAKNRERYVQEISGGKKSDSNSRYDQGSNFYDEIDREDQDDPSPSRTDISGGSNWWEDPRSAVDMFEFKKRDDDAEDEDDDEESAPGNSEFDYAMPRVKREKDDDGEDGVENGGRKIVRVYRRAGFGELYHEKGETQGESGEGISKVGRVQREIREAEGPDKINDEGNTDGVKTGETKRVDINVNENENGHYLGEASGEIKNFGRDNPAEKSGVLKAGENAVGEKAAGTFGDGNLEEEKNAGFLSAGEKRSSSLGGTDEKHEPTFSAGVSSRENIKSRLDEPNISTDKISGGEVEKKEVEKSEPTDDDVHKLSQDPNGDERRDEEKKSGEKAAGIKSENEMVRRDSGDKIIGDEHKGNEPDFTDASDDKGSGDEREMKVRSGQDSETVVRVEPENSKMEIRSTDREEGKSEKDGASESKESPEELGKDRKFKQEENHGDKRLGYSEKDNEKYEESGVIEKQRDSGSDQRGEGTNGLDGRSSDTKMKDAVLKREDLTRKLLWVSDQSKEGSKSEEIRDGRRDSAWDQNRGEKSGERPARFLKTIRASPGLDDNYDRSKFVERSAMVSGDNIADRNSVDPEFRGVEKRGGIRPLNTDTDSDPWDESDFEFGERPEGLEKRSVEKIVERRSEPDLSEYGSEIEDEDFNDSPAKNEGEENRLESDVPFSNRDRDRDPMRDRINMLIKEKLDDRGKGKLKHFKREIDRRAANIEYYDYDSDVNGVDAEGDSTGSEDDRKIVANNNCSDPQDKGSETMTKKDENQEDERKQELEQERRNHKPPKEEFISDVVLGKTQKKKPTYGEINAGLESAEKSYRRLIDNDFQESNTNSNSHWLGQPAEADPEQEIESIDRRGRYRDIGEPGEQEKSLETGKVDVLGEPLEYSVKVHGKLDPESIDAMLNEKANFKDKESGDNEKLKIGTDGDWKYEGIRGRSRSRSGQGIDADQFERDQRIGDKSSARNFRHDDSARIEEGTNDRASFRNSMSYDRIIRDGSLYGKGDNRPSLEARLVEDTGQDSLPTMLDRSETRNLAPGERSYLVIAPPRVQCPRKSSNDDNSSSSSSNYLALKITDDMFKGGIEQSNPTEDKIPDSNFMGKTTTEWKVIKVAENARAKPQNFALNPRDVAHESIVDPEEMVGDFDDDVRPRFGRDLKCYRKSHRHFGRSLQSVSYPIDPFQRGDREVDMNGGEEPVDKYLEGGQNGFEKSETTGHRIKKRSVSLDGKKAGENFDEDRKISGMDSGQKNFTGVGENLEKRSFRLETPLTPDGDNGTRIDKGKRGFTNVEEWEIDAPTVQKQLQNIEKYAPDANIAEKKNPGVETAPKTSSSDFYESATSGSHEREIRSVKSKDENSKFDSFPASRESLYQNRRRSKIRGKDKSYDKFRASKSDPRPKPFAKYGSFFGSDPRYNYYERNSKNEENSGASYDHDWKNLAPEQSLEGKRHRSKTDEDWRPNHGRSKSGKGDDESNRRHYQHNALEKYNHKGISGHGAREPQRDHTDPKTQSKSTKGHREKNFKEVQGASAMQNAKSHDKMSPGPSSGPQSKSFQGAKGYDVENTTEGDKKVLEENAEDPVKPIPEVEEKGKKKITVLLAADNMEDESQMDLALHGELAGKIVERIFDQVQKNDALKVALGPGLYRKHKPQDAIASDKIYRQGLDDDEVKHTEGMMKRVMELLGRLILDEVQRKTCTSLPPDMREFLQWMLGVEDDDKPIDQVPPLPFVNDQEPNQRKEDKFLFEDSLRNENADIAELNKKVRLLRGLINEYNTLTDREKTKVQSVHDYLVRQLGLLLKYIDAKVAEGGENLRGRRIGGGNILQYQNAVPNANGTGASEPTLSPLVNTRAIMMLSNASFAELPKAAVNHLVRSRFRETRSSEEEAGKTPKKRKHGKHKQPNEKERDQRKRKHKKKSKKTKEKKKKKKKKNKNKKHHKRKGVQSPEYKKLIRRAAMLRKKRADLYEDNWDPIYSGYEEPVIYTSNGKLTNKLRRSILKQRIDDDEERMKPRSAWADVLSGKLNGEVIDGRDSPNFEKEANSDAKIPEKPGNPVKKNLSSGKEMKRDVIGTSIALQPWLNPKSNDLVSSDYLKELTNELVHGSVVPPIYQGGKFDEEEKGEVGMTEGQNISEDEVAKLLSKREAWKNKNEEQLEEVAFGKDMRGKWKEKEQFEKLTEMDRKRNPEDSGTRKKREGDGRNSTSENDPAIPNDGAKFREVSTPVKKGIDENATLDSGDSKNSETLSVPKNEMEEHSVADGTERGDRSSNKNDFLEPVKMDADEGSGTSKSGVNFNRESETAALEKRNEKRSSPLVLPEAEGPAILPSLEVTEERRNQKQAAKTQNDDQRDIADQMLGFESPLITGLINTY